MQASSDVEPDRLSSLRRYDALGKSLDENIRQVIQLVAFAFDVPHAAVVLTDDSHAWPAWMHGLERRVMVEHPGSFCARVLAEGRLLVLPDARRDPVLSAHPLVDRPDPLFFYAGIPLVLPDGKAIGSLSIHDRRDRRVTDEQSTMLAGFAKLIINNIELQRETLALAQVEAAVESERGRLVRIIDSLPFDLWLCDSQGRYILQNKVGRALWGANIGKRPGDTPFAPEVAAHWEKTNSRVLAGETMRGEFDYPIGGRTRQVEEIISPMRDEEGRIEGLVGISLDISERRHAETARRESDARLKAAVESLPFDFWTCDALGRYVMINSAARMHWGDLQGLPEDQPVDEAIKASWVENNQRALAGERLRHEATYGTEDEPRHVDVIIGPVEVDGRIIGLVGVNIDITERKLAEQRLAHLAHHDPVTGLANRRLFQSRLADAVARSGRQGYPTALLLLDLDGFKEVNDTLGHDGGDALLVEVASRLRSGRRATDLVARLGGDEFAVILEAVRRPADAEEIAAQILADLGRPFQFEGHEVRTSASIGITTFPADGASAPELLRHADLALYGAKHGGRGHWRSFTGEQHGQPGVGEWFGSRQQSTDWPKQAEPATITGR